MLISPEILSFSIVLNSKRVSCKNKMNEESANPITLKYFSFSLISLTCPSSLRHLSIISFINCHIKAISKSYIAQPFNDMGYVRL